MVTAESRQETPPKNVIAIMSEDQPLTDIQVIEKRTKIVSRQLVRIAIKPMTPPSRRALISEEINSRRAWWSNVRTE